MKEMKNKISFLESMVALDINLVHIAQKSAPIAHQDKRSPEKRMGVIFAAQKDILGVRQSFNFCNASPLTPLVHIAHQK